jgi:hypothetical protein
MNEINFPQDFPSVESIQIEITPSKGVTTFDAKTTQVYSLKDPPPKSMDCPRGGCTGQGLNVKVPLIKMIGRGKTEAEETVLCKGVEKMGRTQARSCLGNIKIRAIIKYKKRNDEASPAPP